MNMHDSFAQNKPRRQGPSPFSNPGYIIREVFCLSDEGRRARFSALQRAHVLVVGQGSLGSKITLWLARQGVGAITACDPDVVEPANIPLQDFDMGQLRSPKAIATEEALARAGLRWTRAVFYPLAFQAVVDKLKNVSVAICVADNDATRLEVSRWARRRGVPVVTAGISPDGWSFYVSGQRPGGGCLACAVPEVLEPGRGSCTRHANPGIIPVVAGYALQWALGCLVEELRPQWDRIICDVHSGWMAASLVKRNPECPECREEI